MRRRRLLLDLVLLVLAAAGLAALLGRVREPSPPQPLATADHLTILGVRPGMERVEVEALLGPGRPGRILDGIETTAYGRAGSCREAHRQDRWAEVTWTRDGRVGRVVGSHLHRDGREILGRGWPLSRIGEVLGPPTFVGAEGWCYAGSGGLAVACDRERISSFTLGEAPPSRPDCR